MEIEKMQKMNNINMLLDAVESEIVEKDNTVATGDKAKKEEKKLTIEYFGTDLTFVRIRIERLNFSDPRSACYERIPKISTIAPY